MIKTVFSFVCLSLLITSCGSDDGVFIPAEGDNVLYYDGANFTGPNLEAAEYEAAAYFPASITSNYTGKRIIEVQWFMGLVPADCDIKIYSGSSGNAPGDLLYTANISLNSISTPAWNTHIIPTGIEITGEALWISVALLHNNQQQSIGCDSGPADGNGDWLFSSSDNSWQTFSQRTGENINWNIRGIVSE